MSEPPETDGPEELEANVLIPRSELRTEDDKDRSARRWSGLAILLAALALSAAIIYIRPDGSQGADKAWNLLFIIVGYAGAYIFKDTQRRD
jgi:hypothetical protein